MNKVFQKSRRSWSFSPTQIILLGFFGVILAGTLLLCLPFATSSGEPAAFVDALFTATTSVCVTGLVVVETAGYWSLFGHIVILVLIQCGGLGIISFTTATLLILRKKVTLRDRILLEEAFNLNSLRGLLRFLKKVFQGTFVIEGIGMIVSAISFVPVYGLKGLWYAVFHSISAFCNAGLDLLGSDSLIPFEQDVLLNVTTMFLIVAGGLGFPVWFNLVDSIRYGIKEKCSARRIVRKWNLHTKIVLSFTSGLIIVGAVMIFLLERHNPGTLGGKPVPQQILSAVFQSVTLRTAGFCTIPQQNLTDPGAFVSILLMFVGGSPIGTAGGMKTTTIAVLIIAVWSLIRGKQETTVFGRTLSTESIRKALGVVTISIAAVGTAILLLLIFEDGSFMDSVYEVVSATATVGLSRNFTGSMGAIGKVIIIICMYLGRIGPISLAIALGKKKTPKGYYSFPTEDIPVG